MAERLLSIHHEPLPPITPGEIVRTTPNFRVVTDYKPGLEGNRDGERFFLEPLTGKGQSMLMDAAKAHNIYNFNHRPVYGIRRPGIDIVPCLRADYIVQNVPVLLAGEVQIPKPGEDTIPSPDRMDLLIEKQGNLMPEYTFSDDLPHGHGINNPMTRHLRLLQMTHKDEIPDRVIHSNDPDSYYKVRKNWWAGILSALDVGIEDREFTDPLLVIDIQAFMTRYFNDDFGHPDNLTTSEDIQTANELINKIWSKYGDLI